MTTNYLVAKNGIEILHEDGLTQILSGDGDPSITGKEASIGSIFLRSDDGGGMYSKIGDSITDWILTSSGTDIDNFLELVDTPEDYSSSAGKFLTVDAGASRIEFINVIDGGSFI